MRKIRKEKGIYILIVTLILMLMDSVPIYATEGETEATGSVILPTVSEEIVSVVLPTVSEVSPFDFIIDPQGLIYETDAAKYGGGRVEEGAHLLFHNSSDDGYDFSRYSDELTVTNKSTVPVMARITARMTDLGEIALDQDGDFDDDENPAIYLAVVDDEGNEKPLSEDGEVVIEIEMQNAPSGAYTYHYNAENDTYEYAGADDGDIEFDTYSFGLHGECNADADWQDISVSPKVTVTWEVEPVMRETKEFAEETEDYEEVMESEDALNTDSSDDENQKEESEMTSDLEDIGIESMEAAEENTVDDETEKSEDSGDADGGTSDTDNLDAAGTSDTSEQEDPSDADNTDEADNGSLDEG